MHKHEIEICCNVCIANGVTQSVVAHLTIHALRDAKQKERDAETYLKNTIYEVSTFLILKKKFLTSSLTLVGLLCSMKSNICYFAQTRYKNATYRSTTTTSEFMSLMDMMLDDEVNARLRNSFDKYNSFTLMADETSINNKSYFGVYTRFLEGFEGQVITVEEFIFIIVVTSTSAEAPFDAINKEIHSRKTPTHSLKCVSFDGAAIMSLYCLMRSVRFDETILEFTSSDLSTL